MSFDLSTRSNPTSDLSTSSTRLSQGSVTVYPTSVVWRLYLSHILSTWNARTFEFGAVIFLSYVFPGTLFYASCYALFRSAAAAVFSPWLGGLIDRTQRLKFVRWTIVWQRASVAISCLLLQAMLRPDANRTVVLVLFGLGVGLACLEKLAFIGNTVAIERDWVIVVSDSLELTRQDLNSVMRRIDLACKLIAPLCISLVDAYSTRTTIWVVFGQNAISAGFEYLAIAQVFAVIPELGQKTLAVNSNGEFSDQENAIEEQLSLATASHRRWYQVNFHKSLAPWQAYIHNPAFLASFSLSLLYFTVLSFNSQMMTYLLAVGFASVHISLMRFVAVLLELAATCTAPIFMRRIGAVRSGLWFVNEQLVCLMLAVGLFAALDTRTKLAGGILVAGVSLSRVGLWSFDLCVQYLVQEDAPESSRGSFSAIEAASQNLFELLSFATTMIFSEPEEFRIPVYISTAVVSLSAVCWASFVRRKRGHLLHISKCFKRNGTPGYRVLPAFEGEELLQSTFPHDHVRRQG
ncbi:hypothetical protein K491DRAFT_686399 [Lophiostoma macrostomum CBS 122681]|uniref:Solute carrier family 40 member n=1 Tax=Lophiostoma macrostomum CBS 122681 TaxID=1314788 RepID=A0A6A6TRU6_9PLEO|nr:hypothetical protein K491DRAFT_686399 [Lophiostoma macrostomum CBS 122681]